MPGIEMINGTPQAMVVVDGWSECTTFNSKGKIVDSDGKIVTTSTYTYCTENQYEITGKLVSRRYLVVFFLRFVLGSMLVLVTFGQSLNNKWASHLLRRRINKRFVKLALPYVGESIGKELVFGGAKIPGDSNFRQVNFARFAELGKLTAVTSKEDGTEYALYEGSDFEALLLLCQNREPVVHSVAGRRYYSPISHFFESDHQRNITPVEFCTFLLAKDLSGTPRICTLNRQSTLEALQLCKEHKVKINFDDKREGGKTLFALWVASDGIERGSDEAKDRLKIIQLILELDPSVIRQVQGLSLSPFVQHAIRGSREIARLLLDTMTDQEVSLSDEEQWIAKAVTDDDDFADHAFTSLKTPLKSAIFFVANSCHHERMVKRLKPLITLQPPEPLASLNIFAQHMDIITIKERMATFLSELRTEGELLTQEEFDALETKENYVEDNSEDIGQILGGKFIAKVIKANKTPYFKVLKRIAVVKDKKNITFTLDAKLDTEVTGFKIYREKKVGAISRQFSVTEEVAYVDILQATGLIDCSPDKLIFGEDGIYFTSHSYASFTRLGGNHTLIQKLIPVSSQPHRLAAQARGYTECFKKYQEISDAYIEFFQENSFTNLVKGVRDDQFSVPFPE
jgi:hypothetical protein